MILKKQIALVAGARPNFMKIAPVARALDRAKKDFSYRLVHTGQHYDEEMNAVFFRELGIPEPLVCLNGGGGTHAEQTAKIMIGFEKDCIKNKSDLIVVVGDVNSTLACSVVAKKLRLPVAHIEAGLRSKDRHMPEEINRIVTDSISDLFFVTEPSGRDNLLKEGHSNDRIHCVGNVMVDNLFYQMERLASFKKDVFPTSALKTRLVRYGVITLHRPSNVDDQTTFRKIAAPLREHSAELPMIYPVHPRAKKMMERFGIDLGPDIHLTPPLPYMEFLNLWKDSALVLTDSGGLQEETTALGISCLTLRDNTERPITIEQGTNRLVGTNPDTILAEARKIIGSGSKVGKRPDLWDGHAADRIVEILQRPITNL